LRKNEEPPGQAAIQEVLASTRRVLA
jgi:hypothetical protein